ncbi:hypothetical protein A9K55_002799 [Cordyceps militaris]|uniref:DUF3752 domain-containing protein n=1 Tax=Cordyceps militaris TaxID=73501 RepID=A0A2H4S9C9_CORMI|nr:hypothetical protein A9K55_002799 [Cordyceps militaris]
MSSIGPQLPPQPSSKRKRTPEPPDNDENGAAAPKHTRRNANEIDLDDASSDSDDEYGPRAPAAPTASRPSLGPSLPPPAAQNTNEISLDDSDSDSGPAPPFSAPPAKQPATAPDSDSDSDDDYGPALPSASNARHKPIGPAMPPSSGSPSAPVRDEWMLAPPVNNGYTERDPTKLKARKFTSKPFASASASSAGGGDVAAIWTETPEEKLKRLQDAVLGRSDGSGGQAAAVTEARSRDEEARNRKIAASIAATRGKSLYDEHQGAKEKRSDVGGRRGKAGEDEDDDPSKRAFDREKDMALGSKIGTAQRRELVAKSANFGGRFQKGSFL